MILIHPPVVKPSEPPPGIAKLAGALHRHGIKCTILDANLEGILSLLESPPTLPDKWTVRAIRNRHSNLSSLRNAEGYLNFDQYKRSIADTNRLLGVSGASMTTSTADPEIDLSSGRMPKPNAAWSSVHLSLGNFQDESLSPVRSADLVKAAEAPQRNPFYPYFKRRLTELLETECPSVVGFSLNFLSQALCTFSMLGFLRQELPELTLVLGGGLTTSWMRRPGWRNPFGSLVDHMIAGQGEHEMLSLLGVKAPADIHYTPDYRALPLSDYLAPGTILPYSASSGCYWNKCAFCPERAEGNPYIPISVHQVTRDLRILTESTKPVLIHLLDNAVSPALMKALCLEPPGVPWYGFVRLTRHFADLDFCMALRRSGCVMLKLGLESGAQSVLDHEQKGVELALASSALHTLKKAGIATYIYLLFGTPSESLAEARKTLEFTVQHAEMIDFLNLAVFNLPVHGPESRELEIHALYEGDLSLYTGFVHPGGWNRGQVRQFLDKEFKRHPAIAPILRKDPPIFTSNHAAFFCAGSAESIFRFGRFA